jgi:hypothetical protein
MGCVVKVSRDFAPWIQPLPGGLSHSQIPACGAGRGTTLRSVEPGPIHRNHRGEVAGRPGVMCKMDSGWGG